MANTDRVRNLSASAKETLPAGGRLYALRHRPVSTPFIESLKVDGVSRGTIDAIRDDNARRERIADTRGAVEPR